MLSAPMLLSDVSLVEHFECGIPSLDQWLQRRARANQVSGASRTYVVCDELRVVGYYCLASGGMDLAMVPGPMRRNMPDPIPVAILGRLAVDRHWRGQGIGGALLQDAVRRTRQAASILGIRGLMVHALTAEAAEFYRKFSFIPSATQPLTLILSLK